MKTILASVLALGLMTSAALAAPAKLTTAQMDGVKAGQSAAISCGLAGLSVGLLGSAITQCPATAGGHTNF